MNDLVKRKLNEVDRLYPTSRIEKSIARWQAVYENRLPYDRYPFVFEPFSFNYYDDVHDKESRLHALLDEIIYRGVIEDDFIPALFPGCKQSTIPGMFGAKEIVTNGDYSCERIIKNNDDIDRLPRAEILPGSSAQQWLEMQEYFLDECEGRLPINVCDMQGSMDVAGQLFGYDNLFLCAYDDSERFFELNAKTADAFCLLWDKQKRLLGEHMIPTHLFGWNWAPTNIGASLSADILAMMSQDFFDAFYAPVLEDISKRMGGLVVHSCGNFSAVMESLREIKGINAVNAGQMSVSQVVEAGWDKNKAIISREKFCDAEQIFSLVKEQNLSPVLTFTDVLGEDELSETKGIDIEAAKNKLQSVLEFSKV